MTELCDVGIYGLSKTGKKFALNIASNEIKVCIGNTDSKNIDETIQSAKEDGIIGANNIEELLSKLSTPKRVILFIEGEKEVDDTIAQLSEYMEEGDVIVDCSNNNDYLNSIKRCDSLATSKGIYVMDMGICGDARYCPSLMPGGEKEAYDLMEPILSKCASQVDDEPCVSYIGPSGSGNYVTMVQKSIECADMQLIAEAYDILRRIVQMSNKDMADKFSSWSEGDLSSYLMEITSKIIVHPDDITGEGYLLDFIQDKGNISTNNDDCSNTVKEAVDNNISVPSIASALDVGYLSSNKEERVKASSILHGPRDISYCPREQLIEDLQYALYSSKICIYAQGLKLIQSTSTKKSWNINLSECIRIWKANGCILRSKLLDKIQTVLSSSSDPSNTNILLHKTFAEELKRKQFAWRRIVTLCVAYGVACPTFCSSLNYYDTYRCERLPSNLILAFHNHIDNDVLYERTDREGQFKCGWNDAAASVGSGGEGSDKENGPENEDQVMKEEMSKKSEGAEEEMSKLSVK